MAVLCFGHAASFGCMTPPQDFTLRMALNFITLKQQIKNLQKKRISHTLPCPFYGFRPLILSFRNPHFVLPGRLPKIPMAYIII